MNRLIGVGLAVATLGVAGAAMAAPAIEIKNAVVRVVVIPEARADVAVSVVKTNPRAPIRVTRVGDHVIVDGGLGWRLMGCHASNGRRSAAVWGGGDIQWDDMPRIVVRTPMDAKVSAGGAVYGVVGRTQSLDLSNAGCGDWVVANVAGPLNLRLAGSGDVHTGSAGAADIKLAGSSDVFAGTIRNGLTAAITGAGDVHANWLGGPLHARIAGSGDVYVRDGAVGDMNVAITGSGDVSFGGAAQSLEAQVAGSGDVKAARVTGAVSKQIMGSGDVIVGPVR